jgi:N-methylhydantoinase B
MPIEATESEFPAIMIRKYALRTDSGGAGERRGGCGIWREYMVKRDGLAANCFGDRQRFSPWGMEGGMDGEPGAFFHVSAQTGEVTPLGAKTTGYPLKKGDIIRVFTPGAGGVGNPGKRPERQVLRDVLERKVSIDAAKRLYGVEILEREDEIELVGRKHAPAQGER